jgi:hypothetical protein
MQKRLCNQLIEARKKEWRDSNKLKEENEKLKAALELFAKAGYIDAINVLKELTNEENNDE